MTIPPPGAMETNNHDEFNQLVFEQELLAIEKWSFLSKSLRSRSSKIWTAMLNDQRVMNEQLTKLGGYPRAPF